MIRLINYAIYSGIIVSSMLVALKFLNYYLTNSMAVYAGCLDSISDFCISICNLILLRITSLKKYVFLKGFDKLISFFALMQVLFIGFMSLNLLIQSVHRIYNPLMIQNVNYGVFIILLSLLIVLILVLFQSYVLKKTKSMIIAADILHYKTDFVTNSSILVGILISHFFEIYWIDGVLSFLCALYLFYMISPLFKLSMFSLLEFGADKDLVDFFYKEMNLDVYLIKKQDIMITICGANKKKLIIFLHSKNFDQINIIKEKLVQYFSSYETGKNQEIVFEIIYC